MNRQILHRRVEADLSPRLGPGERIVGIAPAWAASAPPGLATLLTRRRIHAVAVTTDRLAIYELGGRGATFDAVVDRAYDKLTLLGRRTLAPLVRVSVLDVSTPWLVEFRPRDRKLARAVLDALDGHLPAEPAEAAAGLAEPAAASSAAASDPATEEPVPAPPPLAPGFNAPTPEAVLAVLAMGEPDAVALLVQTAGAGFPPPPDPLPVVDRRSVRHVAAQLRTGQSSPTEAQRWAVVVLRAATTQPAPLVLDPDDPFPDQLHGALRVLRGLGPGTDPEAAAAEIEAVLDGRARA